MLALRSLFCYARLTPAHAICREAKRFPSRYCVNYRLREPTEQEALGPPETNPDSITYKFHPVKTPEGDLQVWVQSDKLERLSTQSVPIPTRIIPNYCAVRRASAPEKALSALAAGVTPNRQKGREQGTYAKTKGITELICLCKMALHNAN